MAKKILAVDDERYITRLIEVNLKREGYVVTTALDGKEALEKVAADRPDLIILDVKMPHMDGFAVLKALKESDETRDIPVVMLTAKRHDADILMSWKSGVECFLSKPFSPPELSAILQRIFAGESLGPDAEAT